MFYKGTSKPRTTPHSDPHTTTDSDHIRGVGYVRVSTDMQALEGGSLDAQSDKIQAYCKLHDVELMGIPKDEGLSAKSLERPGLKSALAKLERGRANTLLVGTIVHFDGATWTKVTNITPPTGANLRVVWGAGPTNIYAVGDAGTVLHYLP